MARLILSCKSSCLAKTSLLGLITSAPLQTIGQTSCFQNSVRNISKHRGFLSSEAAFSRKSWLSYPALYGQNQTLVLEAGKAKVQHYHLWGGGLEGAFSHDCSRNF
ncbi:hypothetical protein POTOM_013971 [Populus tomentosa]|uniref:Uncharacterized protein n=1 Tax=Populus tomentosa TaxID=118781 RepID=A0A8X8A1R1_POPTO|nr:hypothetical protein POTOM_013971 [Populus tomentosa]